MITSLIALLGIAPRAVVTIIMTLDTTNTKDDSPQMQEFKGLRIMQWNCNGISSKLPNLLGIATEFDVLCCQESLLQSGKNFVLNNFNLFRQDILAPNTRGVIAVDNTIICTPIDLSHISHTSIEIVGVKIHTHSFTVAILSVYRHPNTHTPISILQKIFALVKEYPEIILTGDFNAHCTAWGSAHTDTIGERIAEAVESSNLAFLFDGFPTRIPHLGQRPSMIDLVVVSLNFSLTSNVVTMEDALGSDHFPIMLHIEVSPKRSFQMSLKIQLTDKQLANLSVILDNNEEILQEFTMENPVEEYERFVTHIKQCIRIIDSKRVDSSCIKSARDSIRPYGGPLSAPLLLNHAKRPLEIIYAALASTI